MCNLESNDIPVMLHNIYRQEMIDFLVTPTSCTLASIYDKVHEQMHVNIQVHNVNVEADI